MAGMKLLTFGPIPLLNHSGVELASCGGNVEGVQTGFYPSPRMSRPRLLPAGGGQLGNPLHTDLLYFSICIYFIY